MSRPPRAGWWCGFLLLAGAAEPTTSLRIAYVVSTWWPKIDGAAIAVMGHVRHFVNSGQNVLVVRPEVNAVLLEEAERAAYADPLPANERLHFVDYGTVQNARAGGYELVIDPMAFGDAEAKLKSWQPDVILVMDPDLFMFDAFRIPGFAARPAVPPPVTIACFTTYFAEAVRKMPDFWWIPTFAEPLLHAGVAMAYGGFDHIFVNGEPTRKYLETGVKLGVLGGVSHGSSSSDSGSDGSGSGTAGALLANELDLSLRATVVPSRGVPPDYCELPSNNECATVPAAEAIANGGSPSLVYVGRLAYDKYVDELLAAYSDAVEQLDAANLKHGAVLYLAGSGELNAHAEVLERRYPGRLRLLGSVAPGQVSCLLRSASGYISSAPNETYGRAQVEALRCSLPLLTMSTKCNMHVQDGINGLLAADRHELAANIVRIVREPELLQTLTQGARASSRAPQLADPNAKMLEAIIATHQRVLAEGRPQGKCWHALWSALFVIGHVIDGDQPTLIRLTCGFGLALLLVGCFIVYCCCRGTREGSTLVLRQAVPRKRPKKE